MAELHAKEAPARVHELEAWGALFDRTKDGKHSAAQFRRPSLSAAGARGRPHGPGDDPHAAGPRHPPGHRFSHGMHHDHAADECRARGRRVRLRPRTRALQVVSRQGGGAGHRRHRPRVQNHQQQLGIYRRRPCARLSRRRDAARHGVRAVPSDRNGLAAQRARHPGHRRRARRRRRAVEQRRQALHVRRYSGELQEPDRRQPGRRLALHAGRQERAASAGAADARSRGAVHLCAK